MKVVLASASPRRQELLKLLFDEFEVRPSNADETPPSDIKCEDVPLFLAKVKAESVGSYCEKDTLVIGCDTSVIVDGEILGKPHGRDDAYRMLKLLSGKEHKVITGCCALMNGETLCFSEETKVTFYELSEKDINDYISTGEPFDKAGAYGIQGYGALLTQKIDGDFFNVVGLPVSRLNREIRGLTGEKQV